MPETYVSDNPLDEFWALPFKNYEY